MKPLLHIAFFVLTTASAAQALDLPKINIDQYKLCTPGNGGGSKVDVPAGTLVILELNEKVPSGSASVGKMVQMRVRTHVKVDGEVVIRTGVQAIGRVKSIEKGNYNAPEMITLELYYVMSVDGQQLSLHGNEQTFPAENTGDPTHAPVNSVFTAQLMNNEIVEVP